MSVSFTNKSLTMSVSFTDKSLTMSMAIMDAEVSFLKINFICTYWLLDNT
jgi:hypothetical protein